MERFSRSFFSFSPKEGKGCPPEQGIVPYLGCGVDH
jgi:hypothetical protein